MFICPLSTDSTPLRPSTSVASGIGNGNARRRPMSSYHLEPRSPRSSPIPPPFPVSGGSAPADKKGQPSKSPYHAAQLNAYPAPSQPAPPPPPRTVSKNAEPVPRYVSRIEIEWIEVWVVWGIPWCSGYHVSLTHSRSPVRSRVESLCHFFLFLVEQ